MVAGEMGIFVPVDRLQFGEYITDLLGQRRRIEADIPCHMIIADLNAVKNVVEVVVQRISQNESIIVSFQSSMYYVSGIKRTIPTLDAFRSFHDTTPDKTVGVDVSLTILVKFPNTHLPEKQDIRIEISENMYSKMRITNLDELKMPVVRYAIDASNLTWGEDISNHIYNQLRTVIQVDFFSKAATISRKPTSIASGVGISFAILGALLGRYEAFRNSFDIEPDFYKQISKLSQSADLLAIQGKIDLVLRILTSAKVRPDEVVRGISGLCGISAIVFAWVLMANFGGFHAVALNDFSKKIMDERLDRRKNWKWAIGVSLIVGTIASLAAARIDTWIG